MYPISARIFSPEDFLIQDLERLHLLEEQKETVASTIQEVDPIPLSQPDRAAHLPLHWSTILEEEIRRRSLESSHNLTSSSSIASTVHNGRETTASSSNAFDPSTLIELIRSMIDQRMTNEMILQECTNIESGTAVDIFNSTEKVYSVTLLNRVKHYLKNQDISKKQLKRIIYLVQQIYLLTVSSPQFHTYRAYTEVQNQIAQLLEITSHRYLSELVAKAHQLIDSLEKDNSPQDAKEYSFILRNIESIQQSLGKVKALSFYDSINCHRISDIVLYELKQSEQSNTSELPIIRPFQKKWKSLKANLNRLNKEDFSLNYTHLQHLISRLNSLKIVFEKLRADLTPVERIKVNNERQDFIHSKIYLCFIKDHLAALTGFLQGVLLKSYQHYCQSGKPRTTPFHRLVNTILKRLEDDDSIKYMDTRNWHQNYLLFENLTTKGSFLSVFWEELFNTSEFDTFDYDTFIIHAISEISEESQDELLRFLNSEAVKAEERQAYIFNKVFEPILNTIVRYEDLFEKARALCSS